MLAGVQAPSKSMPLPLMSTSASCGTSNQRATVTNDCVGRSRGSSSRTSSVNCRFRLKPTTVFATSTCPSDTFTPFTSVWEESFEIVISVWSRVTV